MVLSGGIGLSLSLLLLLMLVGRWRAWVVVIRRRHRVGLLTDMARWESSMAVGSSNIRLDRLTGMSGVGPATAC